MTEDEAKAVERVAQMLMDEPFADDVPLQGTTQQDERCRHYARAAIAALIPEGHMVVPREPSEAMISAAGRETGYEETALMIWAAMLAAAGRGGE